MLYVRRRSAPWPFLRSTRSLRPCLRSRKIVTLRIHRSSGAMKRSPFTDYHGQVWPAWGRLKSVRSF